MNTHADKTSENKSHSVSQTIKQTGDESVFQLADNRPETVQQRNLQILAENAPQVQQLKVIQAMADRYSAEKQSPVQVKKNETGLPDNLKSGVENLSGYSLDDVKVHYNSAKPEQVNAHAYAQGTDIHVASGQEKHLPHEAWHIVQQKQGRVKPTRQLKGTAINDDHSLEAEADYMGTKALQAVFDTSKENSCCCGNCQSSAVSQHVAMPIQAKPVIQRRRFLSREQFRSLSTAVEFTISNMEESGDTDDYGYRELLGILTNIEQGDNANDVMNEILNITNNALNDDVQRLGVTVNGYLADNAERIRTANYPSSYSITAKNARNLYKAGRLVANTNNWTCPGTNRRAAHDTDVDDITIDHVVPCASHWNGIGYNSNRQTRVNWYNDTTNHAYMCRACNSSLGSGGVMYRTDKGRNYSN